MNKKGQTLDVITIIASVFAVVITLIAGVTIFKEVDSQITNSSLAPVQWNESRPQFEAAFTTFDIMLPVLVIFLIVGLVITSFLIPAHPVFAVINIVGIFVLVFLGIVLNVVYTEISNDPVLSTGASSLFVTPFIMKALPTIGVIAVLIATIIGFGKRAELT